MTGSAKVGRRSRGKRLTNMQPTPREIYQEVLRAERRIRPHIRKTFVDFSPELSQRSGASVLLKLENQQITGSFKLRGAFNKILSLSEREASAGVVTASSGNHGLATAYALQALGRPGVVFLAENASKSKVEALRRFGVEVEFHGRESGEAERLARERADAEGRVYVSPYNDPQVIAGQGTIGLELLDQAPEADAVFVSVGGGGLVSGVGAVLKQRRPDIRIVGCLPQNSAVMYECVKAGRIVDVPCRPTLSDGTAGSVEAGSITLELCRRLIDDYVLVCEREIARAMRLLIERHCLIVGGSAAVAVAAFLKGAERWKGLQVVLLLCGGNVGIDTVSSIVNSDEVA